MNNIPPLEIDRTPIIEFDDLMRWYAQHETHKTDLYCDVIKKYDLCPYNIHQKFLYLDLKNHRINNYHNLDDRMLMVIIEDCVPEVKEDDWCVIEF